MPTLDRLQSFAFTLSALQLHQQAHHGWRVLHQTLEGVLEEGLPSLHRLLETVWTNRPHISDVHLVTLLGAAVRHLGMSGPEAGLIFQPRASQHDRQEMLARLLTAHEVSLTESISDHSNSFTSARRFLLPQVVLGQFAVSAGIGQVRLLDLGTSLGLLPRAMNNRAVFDRFAPDLLWTPRTLEYVDIPLALRRGVDRDPLPTLDWVHSCYGPSSYYEERFNELLWALRATAAAAAEVTVDALDVLDERALAEYLRHHRFNAVTCGFVLYQYDEQTRRRVIDCVTSNLDAPGIFLSMEPSHELLRMGCRVHAYLAGDPAPLHVADVSDAHFMGVVTIGPDLNALLDAPAKDRR